MQNKWTRILLFSLFFLILLQLFSQKGKTPVKSTDDIVMNSRSNFVAGKEVVIDISNNSGKTIEVIGRCPENPLKVELYSNGEWILKQAALPDASKCVKENMQIEPGKKSSVAFGLWNKDLFSQIGRYRITYETTLNEKTKQYFHEISVVNPSWFRKAWTSFIYKPIFNTLFWLISKMPGHNLGWAIIALTLIIKILLLGPNQKALKSQKEMQKVQPELEAVREKYKNDPQRLAQETMQIWKKHKVHPLGSCLPMLIQFPILIALFYVVKDGLNISDTNMLYAPLKNFDFSKVNTVFLGIIDLAKVDRIALPIIIGGLQFFQIKLSMGKKKNEPKKENDPTALMGKSMQYVMPVMIALFTIGLPAAVGFYWGISTLFAIGQQIVVNRSK